MTAPSLLRKSADALLRTLARGGREALNLLYPPHCVLCLAAAAPGESLCARCLAATPKLEGSCCAFCAEPFEGAFEGTTGVFSCPDCRSREPSHDGAASSRRNQGNARELIHRFKYRKEVHLRRLLGEWLLEAMAAPHLREPPPDALVPVPLHPARQRDRGFNQARLLAEVASRRSGIPLLPALRRIRFTPTQTRLRRDARIENLRNAFGMIHTVRVRNLHLLLVDDVLTTGSTVNECARVLKRAGAASVRVATPLRG